ncbi:hypothetical protein [Streptomyces sp. NPDC014894]|uniref:hypothetical protein n=1 Tax=Streptomyces sp. NPDC014894 TaxID=3364931 RepID=UPI0036FEA02C
MRGQVDPYSGVVGEVLRDVEIAARAGLLRDPERTRERLVQRATRSWRRELRQERVRTPYASPPTAVADPAVMPPVSRAARTLSWFSRRFWTLSAVASRSAAAT